MLPGRPPSQWCLCVGLAVLGAIAILGLLLAIFALVKTGPNQQVVYNASGKQKDFFIMVIRLVTEVEFILDSTLLMALVTLTSEIPLIQLFLVTTFNVHKGMGFGPPRVFRHGTDVTIRDFSWHYRFNQLIPGSAEKRCQWHCQKVTVESWGILLRIARLYFWFILKI